MVGGDRVVVLRYHRGPFVARSLEQIRRPHHGVVAGRRGAAHR